MAIIIYGCFLGSFIPAFLFAKAETKLNSSLAGVFNALVLIIGALFFVQKFTKAQIIGVVIGFSGMFFWFLLSRLLS